MDIREVFWRSKLNEQLELKQIELDQLHAKLREFQQYAESIHLCKKKFLGDEKKYHGILGMWEKELDIIFSNVERLLR